MDSSHKFVRDSRNPGALLNTDRTALEAYKKRKHVLRDKDARINELESRLNNIEEMLSKLMSK